MKFPLPKNQNLCLIVPVLPVQSRKTSATSHRSHKNEQQLPWYSVRISLGKC